MNRILIVEDDPLVTAVVRSALSRGDWEVRHCGDGKDAVAVAAEWLPDLLLLDVALPGMSGFDVCSAVRSADHGEEPLIVIVTAHDELSSKLTGFAVGADDYLVKPINPQELFTRVTKLLASRDAHARTIEQRRRDAIREVATTICHQVNSPLTVVVGYVDLLLHRSDLPAPVTEELVACRNELLRIVEILERLRVVEDRVVPYLGDATMIDLPPSTRARKPVQPSAASTRTTSR